MVVTLDQKVMLGRNNVDEEPARATITEAPQDPKVVV